MQKEIVEKKVKEFLNMLDSSAVVKIEEDGDNGFNVTIDGQRLNYLIGYQGESLNALQHLVSHALFKQTNEWPKIHIDINGYKRDKLEKLEEMVKNVIDRVRFHQKEIKLPYMNSYERRHVHEYVSEYMDVTTESRGEGKDRRLYILPNKK